MSKKYNVTQLRPGTSRGRAGILLFTSALFVPLSGKANIIWNKNTKE
jgi:hypothetical protein